MPDRVLTRQEREEIQATRCSTRRVWRSIRRCSRRPTSRCIKRAASYPAVERVFVNPAIKKALCQAAGKDRAWLGKVRPIWGHNYHFHIRIGCPNGGCETQPPVSGDDGCGKEVDNWLKTIEASLKETPAEAGRENRSRQRAPPNHHGSAAGRVQSRAQQPWCSGRTQRRDRLVAAETGATKK